MNTEPAVDATPTKARTLKQLRDEMTPEEKWHRDNIDRARQMGTRLYAEREVNRTLAAVLLQNNPDNRAYKPSKIHTYAEAMGRGEWEINGEVIKVAMDGSLNDGQNRLQAIIESDRSAPLGFLYGLSRSSRMTLDQGLNRTLADVLTMTGLNHSSDLGAMARHVWEYEHHDQIGLTANSRPSREQVRVFIGENESLMDSLEEISATPARTMGAGRAIVAFAYHMVRTTLATDPNDIKQFFIQLLYGNDLSVGHPILMARQRIGLERKLLSPNEKATLIFKAWNAVRRDERPSKWPLDRAGKLPQLEE